MAIRLSPRSPHQRFSWFSHYCIVSLFCCVFVLSPLSIWPHLFSNAGHEERRGQQLKWSLAFRLYIGSFVFHVHSYQDQFIQPGWAECFFCVFSLCLCFACSFVLFDLFVCPHSFMFPCAAESSPLQFLVLT